MNNSKRVTYIDLDQISKLPYPIIHHIQSYLPLRDAARTCILSKTWNHFCSLYPIKYFDHYLFSKQFLPSYEIGTDFDTNHLRELVTVSFFDFVDGSISNINRQNQPLRNLSLSINLTESDDNDKKYSSRIDSLMEIITKTTFVHHLCLSLRVIRNEDSMDITTWSRYDFKLLFMATKGLQFLSLKGCLLFYFYDDYDINISSSLRRLYLENTEISEDAWNTIASCCPFIECFHLIDCCIASDHLVLSGFSESLKDVNLNKPVSTEDDAHVIMTGTNLESFHYDGFDMEVIEVDVVDFSCIRKITIDGMTNLHLKGQQLNFFQDFSTIFPVLEEAHIEATPIGYGLECLKVTSHQYLRELSLLFFRNKFKSAYFTGCPNLTSLSLGCHNLEDLIVDCPNLRHFTYKGTTIPNVISFNASVDMIHTHWDFYDLKDVDINWFIKLRDFVKHTNLRTIKLSLNILSVSVSITPKEHLGEVLDLVGGCNVDDLELILSEVHMKNQMPLLQWLLWSTCPSTFTIVGYCYDLVKHMCEKLTKKEEEEEERCDKKAYCWWHNVRDYEVVSPQLEIEDIKGNLQALVHLYKTPSFNTHSTFTFHWY